MFSRSLLYSPTQNLRLDSMFWKTIYSVLSCVGIVEFLDENSMVHCVLSSRQIDKSGSCVHVPLVVILYVLSEVQHLAGV